MQPKYTIQDLRKLGVETIGNEALIGTRQSRKSFRADSDGIVFNMETMPSEEKLKVGALLAVLERKASESQEEPEVEPKPKPVRKKRVAKKAPVKADGA